MWESFTKCFIAVKGESVPWCPFHVANEQSGMSCAHSDSHHHPNRSAEAEPGGHAGEFRDLRVTNMTKNETARATIPHQDTRNLSWCAWLSSPRGAIKNKSRREFAQIRRNRHGFARAIENLRGMRMSLVPLPNSGNCLLQGM